MGSVLADFPAYLAVEETEWPGRVEGRAVLRQDELELIPDDGESETIPLDAILDVALDSVPMHFDRMPDMPVTLVFENGTDRAAATIAASEAAIEKFTTLLFKAILNGTNATVKHPARVGGRVTDADFEDATLTFQSEVVRFDAETDEVTVSLDSVVAFQRETQSVKGLDEPVLVVSHASDGDVTTTVVTVHPNQKLTIFARLLKRQYQTLRDSLSEISLSRAETKTLVTIYSTDEETSLDDMLDIPEDRVTTLLTDLREKDLIEPKVTDPTLTGKGQIVVNRYLERVNT